MNFPTYSLENMLGHTVYGLPAPFMIHDAGVK